MSFSYRHRKAILIVLLIILGLTSSVFYLYSNKKIFKKEKKEVKVEKKKVMIKKKEKSEEDEEKSSEVKVDVKGEVNSPGLYTMDSKMRVSDAINAAGGLTYNASTEVINLSKKLKDEMVIIIYSKEEVANFVETKEKESEKIDKCMEGNGGVSNDACIDKDSTSSDAGDQNGDIIVNINTATKEELMQVSGIGEAKADAIIKYREEHTKFNSLDELKEINGIGDNIYAKIKDHLTI